jgi:hypothetical protein
MARSIFGCIAKATAGGKPRLDEAAGIGPEAMLIDGAKLAALKGSVAADDRVLFGNTVLLNFWPVGFSTRTPWRR